MNDSNNNNYEQNNQQYLQQDLRYTRSPQAAPQTQKKGAVSGGEMFVGINLLSKIGVVFIIIGVIAFSAASEGFIHTGIRMALVVLLGFIMLAAGELFFRKGSHVFANALIFGGVAELFICSLIGFHGFHILPNVAVVGMGFGAAAIGMLLSVRYKSQGLLIVTTVFAILPIFIKMSALAFCLVAVYYVSVHCAAAIISRKNNYTGAYVTGIAMAAIEPLFINIAGRFSDIPFTYASSVIAVVFVICCAVCYAGGAMLDGAQSEGGLAVGEKAALIATLSITVFYTAVLMSASISGTVAGISLLVLAVLFAVPTALFSLHFGGRCTTATVLYNFIFITIMMAIGFISDTLIISYILMHIFAAAIVAAAIMTERRLFTVWGITLTAYAELTFIGLLIDINEASEHIPAVIINLVVWFGLMAVFAVKKKQNSTVFRLYTCAALLNAGIVCTDLITRYVVDFLGKSELWTNAAGKIAFSGLLCAVPWMILGFVAGNLKYMKLWGTVSSFTLYGTGFAFLFSANVMGTLNRAIGDGVYELGAVGIIVTVAVNAASVLPVLDITMQVKEKAPKFAKAVGLIVSGYSLMSLTTILGTNDFVKFTSFIISIIYIVTAALWIIIGFKSYNALLRRFGLALALLSSAKLFLFDFSNINDMGRTLLFIGFGITLLCIAFGYGIAEKKLKERGK